MTDERTTAPPSIHSRLVRTNNERLSTHNHLPQDNDSSCKYIFLREFLSDAYAVLAVSPVAIFQLEVSTAAAEHLGHHRLVLDRVERARRIHHLSTDLSRREKAEWVGKKDTGSEAVGIRRVGTGKGGWANEGRDKLTLLEPQNLSLH